MLTTRTGWFRGEFEPKYESTIQFELLGGSRVQDGLMTGNIKCSFPSLPPFSSFLYSCANIPKGSNCRSWDGGSLDVNSTSQNFIWAVGNQKVTSNSPSQSLNKHAKNGFYGLDLTQATGGGSQNPFASLNSTSATSGSGSSSSKSTGSPLSKADKVLIAHGMIFSLASYAIYSWLL